MASRMQNFSLSSSKTAWQLNSLAKPIFTAVICLMSALTLASPLPALPDPALQNCVAETAATNVWVEAEEVLIVECPALNISNISGLEAFSNLQILDLSGNNISDPLPLLSYTQLTALDLSGNSAIDYSQLLPIVANNPGLLNLSLADIAIGDQPLDFLMSPDLQLQSLNLRNTGLVLMPVVPESVKVLDLSDNQLMDFFLPPSVQLNQLDISGNPLQNIALSSLLNSSGLTELDLSYVDGISLPDLQMIIANNPELTKLGIAGFPLNSLSDLPLEQLQNLQWLDVSATGIQDIVAVNNILNLQALYAPNNNIEFIQELSVLPQLRELDVSGNRIIDIAPLNTLTQLSVLILSNNADLDINSLAPLLSQSTNLQKLGLAGIAINDLGQLPIFNPESQLQWLDVSNTGIDNILIVDVLENLQSLYASNNDIEFIPALSLLPQLRELDLSGNCIVDFSALNVMTHLSVLNLSNNAMTDLSPLLPLIQNNFDLVELGLGGMAINDLSLLPIFMPESKLQVLDLSNTGISDIEPLRSLTNLRELNLSANGLEFVFPLDSLNQLQVLNLSDNEIFDFAPVGTLMQLTELNLSNNVIGNVLPLQNLYNLTALDLSGNSAIDYSQLLPIVANNPGLVSLSLADIAIGDQSLNFLMSPDSQLQSLNLRNTGLVLMPVVPDSMKVLDLSDNQLMDFFLPPSVQLNQLDISGNPLQNIDLSSLLNSSGLTELDLSYVDGISLPDVQMIIANNPELTKLGIAGFPLNSLSDLPLEQLQNLQWLDVSDTGIQDIVAVNNFLNLQALYAANNNIEFIQELNFLPQLRELDLSGNRIVDFSALNVMTQLSVLNLSNNAMTDLSPLLPLIQNNLDLVELGLGGMAINDLGLLPIFMPESKLQVLDLSNTGIIDIELLRPLTNLRELNLSGNSLEFVFPLDSLKQLQVLNLSDNEIFDLAPVGTLMQLTELNLSNNVIGNVLPLQNLYNLTALDLSGNSAIDYMQLLPIVANNSVLLNLSLADIAIGDQPLDFLMSPDLQLQSLNLRNTGLVLMPTIPESVKALDLSDNQLMDFFLPPSVQLNQLDISGNPLQNIALSSLLNSSGLTELDLSYVDGISLPDVQMIIANNPELTKLGIAGLPLNSLSDLPLEQLQNLQWLDVSDTGITSLQELINSPRLVVLYASGNNIFEVSILDILLELNSLDLRENYDIACTSLDVMELRFKPGKFFRSFECDGWRELVKSDFNGDGRSDILWRKPSSGDVKLLLNDELGAQASAINMKLSSAVWTAQQGDFNGDQRIDLLWRNSVSGEASVELSGFDGAVLESILLENRSSDWSSSIGDFNGDGIDDILWRQPVSGKVKVAISAADGSTERTENLFSRYSAWQHQLGDFNGDNRTDILWRKPSTGDVKVALSDTNGNQGVVSVHYSKWSAWAATIGDFNGDGRSDILWRKPSSGEAKIAISGVAGEQEAVIAHFARFSAWTDTVGDFNGDGRDDILWRRPASGEVKIAVSNDQGGQSYGVTHYAKFSAWQQAVGDYNGDGIDDILWRKPATGTVKVIVNNALAAQASVVGHYDKGENWQLVR